MNWFVDAVTRRYAGFAGRAHRTEFWMYVLIYVVIGIVLGVVDALLRTRGLFGGLFGLALLLPSLAVAARRLHDSGRSAWWLLLGLTGIGTIVLLVFMCLDGTPGTNEYGPDPKGAGAAATA